MDILATHLQNNKASHGGISQREYNEKFLPKTKKDPPTNAVSRNDPIELKFITALSNNDTADPGLCNKDTVDLVDDSVEEGEGGSKFQSSLPQFRTFIDSLGGRNQGKDNKTKKLGGGFPALEKLLLMDISTEEGILKGAVQFSTTI